MDGLHFIYFADPMCSWCYGFSPVLQTLRQRYREIAPIRVVMGGLRPGTTEPMPEKARRGLVHHWEEISALTGLPFDAGWADRDGFVYDTDPAARAVVLARRTSDEAGLDFLAAAHRAFYDQGRDITKTDVLADIAARQGFDADAFAAELATDALKTETWRDYAISQRAGATGFPTLIIGPNADGSYALVTRGYQGADTVIPAVDGWLANVQPAAG
ncbi:MAG TPA: DsbA family protein [Caulobacteraceae bacterium]|nr:DsbA family protein [Caulobacteraceae bacterium]